jgi:hypothetical protein
MKSAKIAAGLIAITALLTFASSAGAYSLTSFDANASTADAGGRSDLVTDLVFPHRALSGGLFEAEGDVRDAIVKLPPGMLGDPSAVPQCLQSEFAEGVCPPESQVGVADVLQIVPAGFLQRLKVPVFNMQPTSPEQTAGLAFFAFAYFVQLSVNVRTDGDYGLTVTAPGIVRANRILESKITVWGVPGDPVHESEWLTQGFEPTPSGQTPPRVPFFTNPTRCGERLSFSAEADSYQEYGAFGPALTTSIAPMVGCDQLEFEPSLQARPTTDRADSPSGLDVDLAMPQHETVIGRDEQQNVSVFATEGQFNLVFGGQTTGDLSAFASPEEVQAALEGLSTIGQGNIAVGGGPASADGSTPYHLLFRGSLADTDVGEVSGAGGTEPLKIQTGSETLPGAVSVTTSAQGVPKAPAGEENATPALRDATVTLPKGLVVNPSSANGLNGCSPTQIGLSTAVGDRHPHFDLEAPDCPAASSLGEVEVITPAFDDPLKGQAYLATPHQNPFGSLLALYLTVHGHGLQVKLAGEVSADPSTGQISTTFTENPQLPVEHLRLHLLSGALAPLRTPTSCGTYSTTSSLTPWSAPESGPPATPSDTYAIDRGPDGGSCNAPALSPSFEAGSTSPIAGANSPFVIDLSRPDGSQELSSLTVKPPPGLLARLAGVPYCPDSALVAAGGRSGAEEQASASCPAASQVGTVDVAAGAGPKPFNAPGKVYLAGPYKGAPLSLAVVTPAVAGPFDLGTVVVRSALFVDPTTTEVTAKSDPIPRILDGIPLDIRDIRLRLDRPSFTINPTSCDPMAVTGSLFSTASQSASLDSRFQVGECARLGFRPKLKLSFLGRTRRTGNPGVKAVLTAPEGQANIAATTVILPRSSFIDQSHVNDPCTRVQFDENACPPKSILGRAVAWSPLLGEPLQGLVYFRSNGGERKLPDIVADLHGQIDVTLVGFIDSVKVGKEGSRVRTRFLNVPDAPVSRFELRLKGGRRGLIENSENLCKAKPRANVLMSAHNGMVADSKVRIATDCRKKKAAKRHGHRSKTKKGGGKAKRG